MSKIRHISEQPIFNDAEANALPNPSINNIKIYRKDDGFWYQLDDAGVETPLVQQGEGFTVFPIWAEESGALSDNNTQWSYGNGATGVISIPVPECEVYAMALQADIAGTSVSIELMQNDIAVTSTLFTGDADYVNLVTPISFNEGDTLGFRTDVETGDYSDVRVVAWCRQSITVAAFKGDKGDDGADGMGGVPNTFSRVGVGTTANINQAAYTEVTLTNNTSPNTIGHTVVGNDIVLDAGSYIIDCRLSVTTPNSQRTNQEIRMLIDGVEYGSEYGEAYLRTTSGHTEAKLTYSDLFTINATSNISFEARQIAAAGTTAVNAARSKIIIHQVA